MSEVMTGKEFAGYESQEEKAAVKKPAPGARRRKKGLVIINTGAGKGKSRSVRKVHPQ